MMRQKVGIVACGGTTTHGRRRSLMLLLPRLEDSLECLPPDNTELSSSSFGRPVLPTLYGYGYGGRYAAAIDGICVSVDAFLTLLLLSSQHGRRGSC